MRREGRADYSEGSAMSFTEQHDELIRERQRRARRQALGDHDDPFYLHPGLAQKRLGERTARLDRLTFDVLSARQSLGIAGTPGAPDLEQLTHMLPPSSRNNRFAFSSAVNEYQQQPHLHTRDVAIRNILRLLTFAQRRERLVFFAKAPIRVVGEVILARCVQQQAYEHVMRHMRQHLQEHPLEARQMQLHVEAQVRQVQLRLMHEHQLQLRQMAHLLDSRQPATAQAHVQTHLQHVLHQARSEQMRQVTPPELCLCTLRVLIERGAELRRLPLLALELLLLPLMAPNTEKTQRAMVRCLRANLPFPVLCILWERNTHRMPWLKQKCRPARRSKRRAAAQKKSAADRRDRTAAEKPVQPQQQQEKQQQPRQQQSREKEQKPMQKSTPSQSQSRESPAKPKKPSTWASLARSSPKRSRTPGAVAAASADLGEAAPSRRTRASPSSSASVTELFSRV
ncbi:MAG: hypothetical protein MHM6MM_000344 [Cercozoa sp. M6MM]